MVHHSRAIVEACSAWGSSAEGPVHAWRTNPVATQPPTRSNVLRRMVGSDLHPLQLEAVLDESPTRAYTRRLAQYPPWRVNQTAPAGKTRLSTHEQASARVTPLRNDPFLRLPPAEGAHVARQ